MAGSASKSAGVSADGAEKVGIGEAAAALLREGQPVLLDSGTTKLEVARAIRRRRLGWVNGKEVFEVVVSLELAGAVW